MGYIGGGWLLWLAITVFAGIPIVAFLRIVRAFKQQEADIRDSLAELDVALLRRHDLVTKLAHVSSPHFTNNRNLISDLNHLHERAMATRWNVVDHARDELRLDRAIEAVYAQLYTIGLNGDARILGDIQREFEASDYHVALAARTYNKRVAEFNDWLKTFPWSVIGRRLMHLKPELEYKVPPSVAFVRPTLDTPQRNVGILRQ